MMVIDIPGSHRLELEHLVLDYNGTLAEDGDLIGGVAEAIAQLASQLTVHIITADTHGTVAKKIAGQDCTLHIIGSGDQEKQKADYLFQLGAERSVAIGNGRNDKLMLAEAALGICVIQREGACLAALSAADVVCNHIVDAFNLLLQPNRLIATLRN